MQAASGHLLQSIGIQRDVHESSDLFRRSLQLYKHWLTLLAMAS